MAADRSYLTRFAWLSIGAAVATIALKAVAYFVTGSVGLLSDALESFINLVGAVLALAMLTVAARPEDDTHAYGHSKAEYFASGVEGTLIVLAAGAIAFAAVPRLITPRPLEQIGLGLAVSVVAALVNLLVSLVLRRTAKRYDSVTLAASSQHLLADVWTSVGVVAGVGAVGLTGWQRLDPIVALAVATHIAWTGTRIVVESVRGLMDTALPEREQQAVRAALDQYRDSGVHYHALRTRQSGAKRFVSVHVLVPGSWTVQRGHELLEKIESDIRGALPNVAVLTHLESLDDPASWKDIALERDDTP
ncbi:MAG TPA: cation diffusion facilitator family transporter [Candidatus Krumholzibacteria bacterium]|nr:cation diffusion facilitator family transporter [Candidatus Krumholzibacteria bacterium]